MLLFFSFLLLSSVNVSYAGVFKVLHLAIPFLVLDLLGVFPEFLEATVKADSNIPCRSPAVPFC
jgi:hypothetical protein